MNKVYLYFSIIMGLSIMFIILIVVSSNNSRQSSSDGFNKAKQEAAMRNGVVEPEVEVIEETSKLTSDELDIWTLPPTGRKGSEEENNNEEAKEDKATDKNETNIKPAEKEIVNEPLTSEIITNQYEEKNFVSDGNKMKYVFDGKTASTIGVELSWKQGNVNMKRLKNSGCEFVYIHVAKRGYASGNVVMDDSYSKNLEAAISTGMKVGVIFTSQAVSKDEIEEEADVLLTAIRGYAIDYPVCIEFETIEDDLARTDGIAVDDMTDLVTYFINEIDNAGKDACIYADNDFLNNRINISELPECGIWLKDEGTCPDYDGKLSFWQYGSGIYSGVTNETRFSIRFD